MLNLILKSWQKNKMQDTVRIYLKCEYCPDFTNKHKEQILYLNLSAFMKIKKKVGICPNWVKQQ